jgi:hypothetical protein
MAGGRLRTRIACYGAFGLAWIAGANGAVQLACECSPYSLSNVEVQKMRLRFALALVICLPLAVNACGDAGRITGLAAPAGPRMDDNTGSYGSGNRTSPLVSTTGAGTSTAAVADTTGPSKVIHSQR